MTDKSSSPSATRGECPTCGTLCVMHPLSAGRSYTPVSETPRSEPPLTCTDAREQQMGCFRAVKAERELAEFKLNSERAIAALVSARSATRLSVPKEVPPGALDAWVKAERENGTFADCYRAMIAYCAEFK